MLKLKQDDDLYLDATRLTFYAVGAILGSVVIMQALFVWVVL